MKRLHSFPVGILLFCAAVFISQSDGLSSTEFGLTMAVRAYDLVCWYEKLRQFPNSDSKGFTRDCFGKAEYVKKHIIDDNMGKMYFGDWMIKLAMDGLPSEYVYACSDYLKDPDRPPIFDESDTLNDGQHDPYPFRGFSYCLLTELRQKHGHKAIDAVKHEKTHVKKHWMTTLLDRENEARARHGSQPLRLIKELTDSAQRHAEKNARECALTNSRFMDRDRQWNGNGTGENLSAGPYMLPEDSSLVSVDGWYEEVEDYPFHSGGYKGRGNDMMYDKIGHFTQTVWKDTQYVGYGYAVNKNCEPYQFYIASRYSPPGNYVGQFQKNVGAPRY